jgi:phage tail-like protein
MAVSSSTIKTTYPLPAYNYRVTIVDIDGPHVLGFSEVSGLSVGYDPVTYKDGLSFLLGDKIIAGMHQPIKLNLKKGLTQNDGFLYNWFNRCYLLPMAATSRCDILIDLCDEQGLPVMRWTVIGALPIKLEAPAFTAKSNEVAIVNMEVIATSLLTNFQPG